MDRRSFAFSAASALLWPASICAQGQRVFEIGFLANHIPLAQLRGANGPSYSSHIIVLEGLKALGWLPGQNLRMHWRSAESRYERHPELAQELVRAAVDLIVAFDEGADAAAKATRTIPIVMCSSVDPVKSGLVASLARPGGNVTGVTQSAGAELAKSISLLKQAAPRISRVAMLIHSGPEEWEDRAPGVRPDGELGRLAKSVGIEIFLQPCRDATALPACMRGAVLQGAEAIWVEPNYGFYKLEEAPRLIAREAVRLRVPVMQGEPRAVEEGGLMAFGVDYTRGYARLPYYVDRILRGARPGDLPIEQPTRVEFRLNLQAAKEIGLEFPRHVLLQADRVVP